MNDEWILPIVISGCAAVAGLLVMAVMADSMMAALMATGCATAAWVANNLNAHGKFNVAMWLAVASMALGVSSAVVSMGVM